MRTRAQRLLTANETKLQCIEHNLSNDLGTKILFKMLDKYVEEGTTYVNKQINLVNRYDIKRFYFVNLLNDEKVKDTVLIRSATTE